MYNFIVHLVHIIQYSIFELCQLNLICHDNKNTVRGGSRDMSSRNEKKVLLTPKKASEKYGVAKTKIYSWIRDRRFNFIKPEKEVLFWEHDFLAFLDSHLVLKNIDR